MNSVEQIVKSVKDLEERFLEAEVDTGDPADDVDTGPLADGRMSELDAFMAIAQNSAVSCMVSIEQMLATHKAELQRMFGDDAESLLNQTKECLQGISELFAMDEEEEEEDAEEESEEGEEESEQPEALEDEEEGSEEEGEEAGE